MVKLLTVPATLEGKDEAIRHAVVTAALLRQWGVASQKTGEVVLRLIHSKLDVIITVRVVSGSLEIYAETYKVDRNGVRQGRSELNSGWLKNLTKAIETQLGIEAVKAK
jgi:hypothetical protein